MQIVEHLERMHNVVIADASSSAASTNGINKSLVFYAPRDASRSVVACPACDFRATSTERMERHLRAAHATVRVVSLIILISID
jgi:hypothetical protein